MGNSSVLQRMQVERVELAEEYEKLVHFFANDPHKKLSKEAIALLRDQKKCLRKYIDFLDLCIDLYVKELSAAKNGTCVEDKAIVYPEFEDAIIGKGVRCGQMDVVVYHYEKMLEIEMKNEGISSEEANDNLSYNLNQWVGEGTPIILHSLDSLDDLD